MKINKLTKLSLAVIATLSITTNVNAADGKIDIHIGSSSVELAQESATSVNIGFGTNSHSENGFYWGTQFDLSFIDLDEHTVTGFGGDFKMGYSLIEDLTIYGLAGGLGQDLKDGQGLGFGFGGGVEYRAFENVALNVEAKSYDMTHENDADYDFDSVGVNLKYAF